MTDNSQPTGRMELSGDASVWRRFSTAQEGIDYVVRHFTDLHGHCLTIQVNPFPLPIDGVITLEKLMNA